MIFLFRQAFKERTFRVIFRFYTYETQRKNTRLIEIDIFFINR